MCPGSRPEDFDSTLQKWADNPSVEREIETITLKTVTRETNDLAMMIQEERLDQQRAHFREWLKSGNCPPPPPPAAPAGEETGFQVVKDQKDPFSGPVNSWSSIVQEQFDLIAKTCAHPLQTLNLFASAGGLQMVAQSSRANSSASSMAELGFGAALAYGLMRILTTLVAEGVAATAMFAGYLTPTDLVNPTVADPNFLYSEKI
ncbi:MAG: hypothetical protein HYU99_01700 [Deltaproteobacteria bacterium]|nr:hypothetical protein [Deltaproteobacteria bacterium]